MPHRSFRSLLSALLVLLTAWGWGDLGPALAQDEAAQAEVVKVEISPKAPHPGDDIEIQALVRNATDRLLLVNVRLLLPEPTIPTLPGVEQIVFLEAHASRDLAWRTRTPNDSKGVFQVSTEVITEGRPLSGAPRPKIPASAKEALAQEWGGTWSSPGGFVYDALLSLQLHPSGAVEGSIHWTLKKASEDRKDYENKIGAKGIEYLWGVYTPSTRTLELEGYRRDDPQQILGLDKYRLTLPETYDEIKGATKDHGTWKAMFSLTPVKK